jgi:hypothetical protein
MLSCKLLGLEKDHSIIKHVDPMYPQSFSSKPTTTNQGRPANMLGNMGDLRVSIQYTKGVQW